MREGLTGRKFLDLYKLEQALESAGGVTKQRPMYAMGKAINWYFRQMYGELLRQIQSV